MQIVARDERSVDLIIKELTDSTGELGQSYHYRVLRNTFKLWIDLQEIPPDCNTPVRLNMIAQHVSGRTYTASIVEREGLRSSRGITKLKGLLYRTLRMYSKGVLKGDLVFHKTSHAGCMHSSDNWPVKIDSFKGGSEHWYITGVTNWILTMRAEKEYNPAPVIESATADSVLDYKRWCVEVGRADRKQVERIHHNEGIDYGRLLNRISRYVKRVELINLLKDTIELSHPTGVYGQMSWKDYIKETDIPRFGVWCYKNGRLSWFTGGAYDTPPSIARHRIKIHANRNTDLGGII